MFLPRSLSSAVEQIARRAAGKDWNLYAGLLEHWDEIVGSTYARVTTPVKVTFPHQPLEARRTGGALTVRLPKGLVMEFSFHTETIRQRINTYFGYPAIARMSLDPFYATPEPSLEVIKPKAEDLEAVKTLAATVDNDELRAALASFGEAVLRGAAQKS